MRMAITFIFGLLLASGAAAQDGQQGSPAPVLRVGVFGYGADGSSSLAAWDTQPSINSVVSIKSLCMVTGGSLKAASEATDAWRFSGKVLSISPDEAILELEWQRIVDRGQPVTAPSGTVQLTLRAGDKVVLDQVVPDGPSQCSIVSASFEARYDRHPTRTGLWRAARQHAPAEAASSEADRAPSGGSARVGARGKGSAASADAKPEWQRTTDFRLFAVDLWLIHSAPERPDEVLHQSLLTTQDGAAFAFSPLTIDTATGPTIVQITGSFGVTAVPTGAQHLTFALNRRVTPARSNVPVRDTARAWSQGSRRTMALPQPDDVLAFEMPPVQVKGQAPLPDQFSVRVRIAPR